MCNNNLMQYCLISSQLHVQLILLSTFHPFGAIIMFNDVYPFVHLFLPFYYNYFIDAPLQLPWFSHLFLFHLVILN